MTICTKNYVKIYTSLNVTCFYMLFTNTNVGTGSSQVNGEATVPCLCCHQDTPSKQHIDLSTVFKYGARVCVICQCEFMVSVNLDAFIANHTPSLKSCNDTSWIRFSGTQSLLFCVHVSTAIIKELQKRKETGVYFYITRCICLFAV